MTLLVAAYNEASCIEDKIRNTLNLLYPPDKIHFIFITDGSTDETPAIISRYPEIELMHEPVRRGKVNAIQRAMGKVDSEIVVFTDANAILNREALLALSRPYTNAIVGAVAGEKRVIVPADADATAGEGIYWHLESILKKWESNAYSIPGAAGELFSIRRKLFKPVADDTILDDMVISLNISMLGYRVYYEPAAVATERSSADIREELKRRIRMAAGGIQSIIRMPKVFSFQNPVLCFQFISHRLLRWIVAPYLLVVTFVLNIYLVIMPAPGRYLVWLLCFQCCWYVTAIIGWSLEKAKTRYAILFVPFYFCVMNYAMIAGLYRYTFSRQSILWDKAIRK